MLCHTLGAERDFLVLVLLCVSSECLEIKLGMHALQKAFIKNMVRSMEIPLFWQSQGFSTAGKYEAGCKQTCFFQQSIGCVFH